MRVPSLAATVLLGVVLAMLAGSASAADSAFRSAVFARGLHDPVHLAAAPGEPRRLYVVEQGGTIRVIERGRVRPGRFLDIRGRISAGGEQGLLGLAFDPLYAKNRLIYVNYTDTSGDTRVVRYRTNGRQALTGTARLLLRVDQPYSNHNGGNVAFGPDGHLYVGLGDGGAGGDPEDRAQDMSTYLGKMLRLDVRRPGSAPEIVGLGLRNPWRYTFDRLTGDLYIGDVGQGAVEEVDITPKESPGLENYGWDLYEGSERYEPGEPGPGKLVFPVFEYGRGGGNCTVVGGYVYRGNARPAERGRYVLGDYCTGIVWSFRIGAGKASGVRREPFTIPGGLSSFGEDLAGEIYATSLDGTVYRIS